jgi:hypothetical protein
MYACEGGGGGGGLDSKEYQEVVEETEKFCIHSIMHKACMC